MVGTANFMDELDCGSFFDHIDDLLEFPTDDLDADLAGVNGDCDSFPSIFPGCSSDGLLASDSVFSANSASDLSAELSVPYEDIVQLEWLSNFVEDSFSGGGMTMEKTSFPSTKDSTQGHFQTSSPVSVLESCSSTSSNGKTLPTAKHEKKARTKRPRPTAFNPRPAIELISDPAIFVPCASSESGTALSGTASVECGPAKKAPKKKKLKIVFPSNPDNAAPKPNPNEAAAPQAVRKCMHCEITKTPQWRAGPMGPKTLCNACGVRYKSGRLFPEYRPAASPTFIPSVHSNSHKKVIEMRTTQKAEEPELIPRSDLLPTCI